MKKAKSYLVIAAIFTMLNCDKADCGYDVIASPQIASDTVIPEGCDLVASINLSSGIDTDGNLLIPGDGMIDPFWRVLNNPPLLFCDSPLMNSINGSSYVVNFGSFDNVNWVNQPTASTLAPMNLGTTNDFGCNNPINGLGIQVPYVFERAFCVLKDTQVNFHFTYKGDDQIYFELVNNFTNAVLSTSIRYVYNDIPFIWSENNMSLSSGSYSLRGYLINTSSVVLGFSIAGSVETSNGDEAISNNVKGCCENNTISILNILDSGCDGVFTNTDTFGSGWTFNLRDSSNAIIRTATANADGNIFFSGLDNGTYTVQAIAQDGYTTSAPAGGVITVTVSENMVRIVEFYNCQ